MKKAFLALALLILAACAEPNTSQNNLGIEYGNASIIGGKAATETDAVTASTVSLLVNIDGNLTPFCTGILISKNLVLSAQHCFATTAEQQIIVSFGTNIPKTMEEGTLREVESFVLHGKYKTIYDDNGFPISALNDVALIKLAEFAPESAQPAPILEEGLTLNDGQELLLAGFGLTYDLKPRVYATGMNYVRVPLAKTVDTILVTDQTSAKGACNGDSGGPAFLETSKGLIVVGITRGAHGRANDCRHFGEYTFASKFKKFILDTAHIDGAELPVFVGL
ncbi:S1 family peptidase [Bdellovibrio reynosensis]|uniref:Trypsin-like serine protease n=1 Tax=Bdellovibrio reynosensis TaxID=2835041 RepID=A0ABY4C587_9BACT|nr:trypsin-like serine protease [Bdellovibrio reynosensis]UOE99988.1 trypsin-like serine protease [Bdellovibrio reynosensis]